MRSLWFVLAFVGCHGSEPVHHADPEAHGTGKHGDVCALGSHHEGDKLVPVTCGPELSCCYPCGIDGCDSVCHTAAECEQDSTRP